MKRAVLLMVVVLVAGCNLRLPGKPDPKDRPELPDQVLQFDALYQGNCAGCHGRTGKLGPAPPLNDPIFLAIVPDAEVKRIITAGRHGTPMPAFLAENTGPLTDQQIAVLAGNLKKQWPVSTTPNLPSYLPGDAKGAPQRGVLAFARACGTCHGDDGRGGMANDKTVGSIRERAYLALISDQALRRLVITGRPDLGMPNYAGSDGRTTDFKPLTEAEIADIVALLAAWREGSPLGGK